MLVASLRVSAVFLGVSLFFIDTTTRAQDFAGVTTEAELIALHEMSNIPRGDMELNGDVTFADFLRFIENLDRTSPSLTYLDGDLNLDGAVDLTDLAIFANNFNAFGYQPEPEPRPANAHLGLHVDIDSRIIVSSAQPADVLGIELRSPSGGLLNYEPIPGVVNAFIPEPFNSSAALPTSRRLSWSDLTTRTIDGDMITRATATSDDITLHWIEPGSYSVYTQSLGKGDTITGRPMLEVDLSLVDLDASGEIDFGDFLILSGNFGQMVEAGTLGDIDSDGSVAFTDFLILSREFGTVLPMATIVPEPSGSGLSFVIIGIWMWGRSQRSRFPLG